MALSYINYLISDRLVFKTKVKHSDLQSKEESTPQLYYPEGLEPAFADNPDLQRPHSSEIERSPPTKSENGAVESFD